MNDAPIDLSLSAKKPTIGKDIQIHLGLELRALYGNPDVKKLPRSLAQLLDRVAQVIRAHSEPLDQSFVEGMMASMKSLRAYAISLTRNTHQAEDLVQETVLRAIRRRETFEAGTNLQGWLMTILKNLFFSDRRRAQREVEDVDGAFSSTMISNPDQEDGITMGDLHVALGKLPPEQRQAIMLVGAEGMAYDEAAAVLGIKVGTLKSRVNRARNRLAELMGLIGENGVGSSRSPASEEQRGASPAVCPMDGTSAT